VILIGLGANLTSPVGPPERTLRAALAEIESAGVRVLACSRFFRSEPVPPSDQPLFVNAVASLATELSPERFLARLHEIEAAFGRVRRERNEARTLDLDLLDYDGLIRGGDQALVLPHPRLDVRAFVLAPLADLAPEWRHPVSHRTAAELLAGLPEEARAGAWLAGGAGTSAKSP
jgi:2-amino-4-hydroxy-6-hydroxymethyldihydropteridine diphosphokinase